MQQIKKRLGNYLLPEYQETLDYTRQLEKYLQFFPKFIDKQVLDHQHPDLLTTDGQKMDTCVMFIDVRGFTSFSENVSLNAANSFLNNFYDIVVTHVQDQGGIMDKFMGDGAMAIFGVYGQKSKAIIKCVAAAQAIVQDFRDMTLQKDEPNLFVGVGIAYGPALVGTFGNGEYVNFTAIGHTVNLAARIQAKAKDNKIYVSRYVAAELGSDRVKAQGHFALKNVSKSVELWEVVK